MGTVLTLSCDYRIATPDTKMGLNETAIGMVPPAWLIAMADRVLGPVNAERAVSSGRIWRASSALELGYLDELVQVDSLLERAVEKALEMSQGHTAARAETKRLQRASVVDLAGPESVFIMWERVSSAPFQAAVSSVIKSLKKR